MATETEVSPEQGADPVAADATASPRLLERYLDLLEKGNDRLFDTLKVATERGTRIGGDVAESLRAGQHDALRLTRRFATHPLDYAGNTREALAVATAAQERSIQLARALYREQAEVGDQLRGFFRASLDYVRGARDLAERWVTPPARPTE